MSSYRKKCVAVVPAVLSLLFAMGVGAQEHAASNGGGASESSTSMQRLLEEIRADKKALVAHNLQLTSQQADKFWPIYDDYQADLRSINQRLGQLITEYADAYNADQITDSKANELIDATVKLNQDEAAMQKKYAKRLKGAVPAVEAARYLQIENKIRAAIRYELAANIPLIE